MRTGRCGANTWAVKLLRWQPGLLSSEADDRQALHREAVLLHKLKHPNIVEAKALLLERGEVTGFAMELLGQSLEAAARSNELTKHRLAGAVVPTCKALSFIHSRLVAHTDVKPANLAFTPTYRDVKLLDFDACMELLRIASGNS